MNTTTIDPVDTFLSDSEGKTMLEQMILQKAERLEYLEQKGAKILASNDYPGVKGKIRPYFLEKVANLKHGQEIKEIERDLRNMCYWLNKSQNKIPKKTEWEKMYRHATEDVQIEHVVSVLLGINNFRRNIKCPFHGGAKGERTASLKIYTKSNRFYCFGCSARGSPIDFVMQYKNYDFREAVEFLNNF